VYLTVLEITDNLKEVMKERYYQEGEITPQQVIRRVANYVAKGEELYGWNESDISGLADEYYETMNQRLWLASSPFLMNAGTKVPMLSACFVMGGLKDDLNAIFETLGRSATVWKMGGGTGFNFSVLREEGAPIRSTGGTSSGVMSWMDIYNAGAEGVKQGGRRRSANMGVLRYDHPEIMKFINYKNNHKKLKNFNISVLVDDKFMKMVESGEDYELVSPSSKITGKANAREVFMKIMENNWKSAEPALIFLDNINKFNPMKLYLGYIDTTNPCGEITLYLDEACNLASINLEEFVDWDGRVDWRKLRYVVRLVVRFLDTAIDVNQLPDERIDKAVKDLRRLGVGIMSLHGALIKAGLKYSSPEGRKFAGDLQRFIEQTGLEMSRDLANEKGTFPLFDKSDCEYPVRNVAITTIAPTGTIQQILNTSSSGCEPIFALAYKRNVLINGETLTKFWVNPLFEKYAKRNLFWSDDLPEKIYNNRGSVKGLEEIPLECQELFEAAMEISPRNHVLMQAELQKYVDNSISKTINMPKDATVEDIAEAYMLGWKSGLKGMTVYREGSRESVLSVGGDTEQNAVRELKRGEIKQAPPFSDDCRLVQLHTGCGTMYLGMTKDDDGDIDQTFLNRGSKGTCLSSQNAMSRLISLALRGGISVDDVVDQLMSTVPCNSYTNKRARGDNVSKGSSCPTAIAYQLKKFAEYVKASKDKLTKKPEPTVEPPATLSDDELLEKGLCPRCKEKLTIQEGCLSCWCGYSKCS
jgi:ribonucleoside-diphosphate reductase alpha chain